MEKIDFDSDDHYALAKLSYSQFIEDEDKQLIQKTIDYIAYLEGKMKSHERTSEAINEALNSGNGTYKP